MLATLAWPLNEMNKKGKNTSARENKNCHQFPKDSLTLVNGMTHQPASTTCIHLPN